MSPLVPIAYLACAIIWGTTYFAIRVSIAAGGYPTFLAAALRFTIAAAVLLVIVAAGWARPVPRGRRALLAIAVAGILNCTSYSLIYTAEEEIPGGLAAVIFGTFPLVTAVISALTGIERPTRASILGAVISLTGLVILSLDQLHVSPAQALGCLMVFLAVVSSATYNMVLKRNTAGANPLAINAGFISVTAGLLLLLATTVERQPLPWPPPMKPTLAVLYLAIVGTVIAFAGYFYLLSRVRLMTISMLVLLQPLIALLVDAFFEAQKVPPRTYAGAAVTLLGVLVSFVGQRRPAPH